jgi:hypothetical protein
MLVVLIRGGTRNLGSKVDELLKKLQED